MTGLLIRLFVKRSDQTADPAVRKRYGVVGGAVGVAVNLLLALCKLAAGLLSASISVMADAVNNLSDAGSSVVMLVGFHVAGKPADRAHPYGHGRGEYIAGFVVSIAIILFGFELAKESCMKITAPEMPVFRIATVVVLSLSILVKLWMSRFNRHIARAISSDALDATARDSLSDVAATGAVLIGSVVSKATGWYIDGWLGLLVSAFVLYSGAMSVKKTLDRLLGEPPDESFVEEIRRAVLSHREISGMHDLVIHDYGPGRSMLSLHAEVSSSGDILHLHDLIDDIENDLMQRFGTVAVIHMDPIATDDEATNRTREKVAALVKLIDPRITIHDFRMTAGPLHTKLIFDAVIPQPFRLSEEEVREAIVSGIRTLDERYNAVVRLDRSYV